MMNFLVTLFATDAALAWRAKKKSTTTLAPIKVDSNFTCEYDAEGYFPGIFMTFFSHLNIQWTVVDPKYCHIYHLCGIGRHQVLQCAGNLWYSPDREECEWPERANCKYFRKEFYLIGSFFFCFLGKAGHLYTSSTSATNMVDAQGNTITAAHPVRPTNVYLPIECKKGVQDHFPDPYDCSAFHYCNGIRIEMKSSYCIPLIFHRWC